MCRHHSRFLAILVSVLSLISCSPRDPASLDNPQAAAVLDSAWKDIALAFQLGPIAFATGNPKGTAVVSFSSYGVYQLFESKGFLMLTDDQESPEGFSGWNNFLAETQYGIKVKRTATVQLTPKGTRLGNVSADHKSVRFKMGVYDVDKVVSNEPADIGTEKYRVVMGTRLFHPSAEFRDVLIRADNGDWKMSAGRTGTTLTFWRESHFRALLKYNPFESKWKPALGTDGEKVADFCPPDKDFTSHRVPDALAELRAKAGVSSLR